jgi:hypothetical protein
VESLQDIIARSPVRVQPGRYSVARCASAPAGEFFMVSRDADEVTVIAEEGRLPSEVLEVQGGYRLIELAIATPFEGVGFLAAASRAVAGAGLNVLIVSTYSKDYLLLKEESVAEGLAALAAAGFPVVEG